MARRRGRAGSRAAPLQTWGDARKGGEEVIIVLEETVEKKTGKAMWPGQASWFPGEGID